MKGDTGSIFRIAYSVQRIQYLAILRYTQYAIQLFWLAVVFTLSFMLLTATPASAQTATPIPVTADQVNAIARELYCPECENIPLDVCPSQACADMREEIRLKLSQGWSKEQIKQYFVERFGDRVLGTPPARGLNWLVYVIPPVAILVGVLILYQVLRAWKRPIQQTGEASTSAESHPAVSDAYVARLEEELKKSDQ
jgi:cytochrome c-type biogenesis protein CcmH